MLVLVLLVSVLFRLMTLRAMQVKLPREWTVVVSKSSVKLIH